MKHFTRTLLTTAAVSSALLSTVALADDPVPGTLVQISAKTVFVPVGFDDNDEALAVIDGYLPDTCYKLAFNESKYDETTKTFKVTQWARKFPGVCLEMLVPFFAPASLGVVPKGDYSVAVKGVDPEAMTVTEAPSSGPDDFLYAPIDSVHVEKDGDTIFGVMKGRFTNSCMVFEEVRVLDHVKTIEVLPIIAQVDDGRGCMAGEYEFTKRIDLPQGLANGRHLLHVRSLNGQSANHVFSVHN